MVSFFDHDLPDYSTDGLIQIANGDEGVADANHHAADFPAYWDTNLRQFLNYDGHNGYDYNVSYQPIYAAAAGRVLYAALEYDYAPDHGYGKMILINHGNGYITLYGHMSQIFVRKGEKVRRGQQLGISGNTGHSTGPHLHFTVFHNCFATDPYGWTGTGTDPLSNYQGDTSEWLWKRQPLVFNPPPNFPGINTLPAGGQDRLILLRLPDTKAGLGSFTAQLDAEARLVRHDLPGGSGAELDLKDGAVELTGPVSPADIYRLPDVASIAAPYVRQDARGDLLTALGRAALATPLSQRPIQIGHGSWTGFLLHWNGETYLVGKGSRGGAVSVQVPAGRKRVSHTIQADPVTGAYAVDLGAVPAAQQRALVRALEDRRNVQVRWVRETLIAEAGTVELGSGWLGPLVAGSVLGGAAVASVLGGVLLRRRRRLVVTEECGDSHGAE